jgi:hypothetical protein
MRVTQDLNYFGEIIAHAQCFVLMIADHDLVKKSFGPMIADHDLVKKSFGPMIADHDPPLYSKLNFQGKIFFTQN